MVAKPLGWGSVWAGALFFLVAPASTQEPSIPLLERIEAGQWEVRGTGHGLIASICLGDRHLLIQPQHGSADCSRNLVSSGEDSATIRYTCPGDGFGQTTIRLETPRLARIDSQGLKQGVPFALRGEARRVGPCR